LTYACTQGLRIETSVNSSNEAVACDSTFYFSPNDNTLDITAYSESMRYADIRMSLGFLQNNATTIDALGDLVVTVTNPNLSESLPTDNPSTPTTGGKDAEPEVTVTPEKPVVKPTTGSTRPVSNPNGTADLEVRPISTGYLQNGVFVESSTVAPTQQAAIKFQIVNVGDKNTGAWSFTADLPSDTDPKFTSVPQQNLGPGDRIEFVLGFNNIKNTYTNVATIIADPSNYLVETSKVNNTARMQVINNQGTGSQTSTNGKADFSVRIVETGVVNKGSNTFVTTTNTFYNGQRVGIKFEVVNNGSVDTGVWKFRADLPTDYLPNRVYTSGDQLSLKPGEKATYTIAFENFERTGNNIATITIDINNQVNEASESNNTANVTLIRN
jgi:hypothetical protein